MSSSNEYYRPWLESGVNDFIGPGTLVSVDKLWYKLDRYYCVGEQHFPPVVNGQTHPHWKCMGPVAPLEIPRTANDPKDKILYDTTIYPILDDIIGNPDLSGIIVEYISAQMGPTVIFDSIDESSYIHPQRIGFAFVPVIYSQVRNIFSTSSF